MQVIYTDLMNLQPKQQTALDTFLLSNCKYLLYGGAMAGGKSYLLRWAALTYVIYLWTKTKITNIPVGLFSEDYPTLKDRQIARIEREFPKYIGKLKDDSITGLTFCVADSLGGGKILLRNLDDPAKYMSTEFAGEFVEELTRNEEQTFKDLRNRLRYPGIDEVKFMGASNPGGIGHGWVKKLFIDKNHNDPEKDKFYYVHANVYDNKYINEAYVKQLEALPEQQRKAYLEGSWDIFAGQVFTEFNRVIHTITQLIPNRSYPHFLWIDWGYSQNSAFAAYLSTIIPEKLQDGQTFNRVLTYKEFYGNQKAPDIWADEIYTYCKQNNINPHRGYTDPAMHNPETSGATDIATLMQNKWKKQNNNQNWLTLEKGLNTGIGSRVNRVAMIHNWLSIAPDGLPYWIITKNCQNLIRTIPILVHDENQIEAWDTHQEDHAADAASYGLSHIKFVKAIESVGHQRQKIFMPYNRQGQPVAIDLSKFEEIKPSQSNWQGNV